MSFQKANTKQEPQELSNLCSVEGCGQLWSVHISGQKPMCSKHQWAKTEKKFKKAAQPVPTTPVVPSWWNKEEL